MRGGASRPAGEEVSRLRSSGGVVVRGCGESLRTALMRSRYGTWVLPKGGIERGEDPRQAARREVSEELGVSDLHEIAALGSTEHSFEREGRRYAKRVDWFLFQANPGAELRASAEQGSLDCGWFSPEQALSMLAHADQRRLVRKALSLLARWQDGASA